MDQFSAACQIASPYIRFLTEALGQPWKP